MASLDVGLFALCLWREARGEGVEGMRAVAWVIWNRSMKWGRSIHDVIMQPNQFTSMTVDPNPPNPEPGDLQMAEATQIASALLDGADTVDPTKGACYYANLATASSGWFFRNIVENRIIHPQTAVIGKHAFFA
jgi:spore germination cell wall hydrolase CwlJ-like protein